MKKDNLIMRRGRLITRNGIIVNVLDMKEEDVNLGDIIHSLSNTCRFGGHSPEFYSVAQHSMMVANYVMANPHATEDNIRQALLHDAAEAYLVDMPSPLKALMPEFRKLEDEIMAVIAKRFRLEYPFPPMIKEADNAAFRFEWANLIAGKSFGDIICLSPEESRNRFGDMVSEYLSDCKNRTT